MFSSQIEEEVTKIDIIFGHLKKFRSVSMEVMLNFACSEGDSVENVLRWCVSEVKEEQRLGFLLSCALDIFHMKRLKIDDLLHLLTDHFSTFKGSPGNEKQPKSKKPPTISANNWDYLTKLLVYG